VLNGVRTRKCWSEEWRKWTSLCYDNDCKKKGIEESLYRGPYMSCWQAWNKFCCEQVASAVAREGARSGMSCQTGEQFWQKSFESVKFIYDILGCTEENRISIVNTRTDERMSSKWCSVIVQTVSVVLLFLSSGHTDMWTATDAWHFLIEESRPTAWRGYARRSSKQLSNWKQVNNF